MRNLVAIVAALALMNAGLTAALIRMSLSREHERLRVEASNARKLSHNSLGIALGQMGECQWKMSTLAGFLHDYAVAHGNRLPVSKAANSQNDQESWQTALDEYAYDFQRTCNQNTTSSRSFSFNTRLYGLSLAELKHRQDEVLLYETGMYHGTQSAVCVYVEQLFKPLARGPQRVTKQAEGL